MTYQTIPFEDHEGPFIPLKQAMITVFASCVAVGAILFLLATASWATDERPCQRLYGGTCNTSLRGSCCQSDRICFNHHCEACRLLGQSCVTWRDCCPAQNLTCLNTKCQYL